MGNCLFGGLGEIRGTIKVITSNGGIMELGCPITVGCIAEEFPGYAMFRSHDLFWKALPHQEELVPGNSYYLLPQIQTVREGQGHVRSNSVPNATATAMAPYRMSFDHCQGMGMGVLKRSRTEVFSNSRFNDGNGVWKVKLVISPQRLLQILEQEGHTQEFIHTVTTVAKCGNTTAFSSFSHHWIASSALTHSSFNHT